MNLHLFRSPRKRFEELALPHAQALFRLAHFRLGNRLDAEDAVQDAYLRAFRSFHTFQAGTNINAWLTRILLNVINDALKRRLQHVDALSVENDDPGLEAIESQSSSLRDPAVQLSEKELQPELLSALQKLPTSLLDPLLLRELEEMTYEEIAVALNIPTGTVMSRLFRARKVVRERLSGQKSGPVKQEVRDDELR
ncbi:MAG TPA: sigma-70 family RNA polymerase sigma factor [Chroococcales cyanobacterium]